MNKLRLTPLLVLVLLLAVGIPGRPAYAQHHLTLIDHFTTNQHVEDVPGPGQSNSSSLSDAMVLGGIRDMYAQRTQGSLLVSGDSGVIRAPNPNPDYYSHSQGSGVRGYTFLNWDGVADPAVVHPTGLGGVDLTIGPASAFGLYVASLDWGIPVILTVYTDGSNYQRYTLNIPGGTLDRYFTISFTDPGWVKTGSGADFTNVGAITLEVNGQNRNDVDFTMDYFETTTVTAVTLENLAASPDAALFRWQLAGFLLPVAAVLGLAGVGAWVRMRKQDNE